MTPAGEWRPKANPYVIGGSVALATFMQVLDSTIVSVAMPHMAGSLAATPEEATWVLTSYLVANAIVLPTSGWLALRFGRKRLMILCTGLFTFASFLCGIAPTMATLILARILQGASGGALQPLTQAILLESFPPVKRGMAMALFGIVTVAAPVIGPTLGGWLTDSYSWRWVFNINIPIGIVAILLMDRFLEDPPYITHARPGKLDSYGLAFLILWLGALQVILDKGQQEDWFSTAWISWFAVISACSMLAFLLRERYTEKPLVSLRVFRDPNYAIGTFLTGLLGAGMFSLITMLPLFLQTVMGYTAQSSGLATTPRGVGSLVTMPLVGLLTGVMDSRWLVLIGTSLFGVSSYMLGNLNLDIAMGNIVFINVIQGAGIAFTLVPLMTMTMARLRNEQMGNAASLYNLMRNLGGGIGISLATTFLARASQAQQAMMVTHLTPYDPAYQQWLGAVGAGLTPSSGPYQAQQQAYALMQAVLARQAAVKAFLYNWRWIGLGIALCGPLVLLMRKAVIRKTPGGPVAEL
ncbi:MAG: DHA2 family efflux MFS transporter permease subunit [Bryobacterales bacterium]|nr:DHA2 family efflux MFS transporter permease subunit [Bryobacterales bacterium]